MCRATLLEGMRRFHALEAALREAKALGDIGGDSVRTALHSLHKVLLAFDVDALRKRFSKAQLAPVEYADEERSPSTFIVEVTLIEARDLAAADVSLARKNSSDPFTVLRCGGHERRSTTIKHALNPKWNEQFTFQLGVERPTTLELEVFDWDKWTKNDSLGCAEVTLQQDMWQQRDGEHATHDVTLQGRGKGTVHFTLRCIEEPGQLVRRQRRLTSVNACRFYEVTLGEGPLGIVFKDSPTNAAGSSEAAVRSVFGAVADCGMVRPGHFLYSINGERVAGRPFARVLETLRAAERPINLGFGTHEEAAPEAASATDAADLGDCTVSFDQGPLGIKFRNNTVGLDVSCVVQEVNGAALRSGVIAPGMWLTSVNGQSTATCTFEATQALLRSVGWPMSLGFSRNPPAVQERSHVRLSQLVVPTA